MSSTRFHKQGVFLKYAQLRTYHLQQLVRAQFSGIYLIPHPNLEVDFFSPFVQEGICKHARERQLKHDSQYTSSFLNSSRFFAAAARIPLLGSTCCISFPAGVAKEGYDPAATQKANATATTIF